MQINFRNIEMILALLCIFLLISACATSGGVGGDVFTGRSWQHLNKTKQEQQLDLDNCRNECEKSVRAKGYSGDFAVFHLRDCEDQCMQSKGYEWR